MCEHITYITKINGYIFQFILYNIYIFFKIEFSKKFINLARNYGNKRYSRFLTKLLPSICFICTFYRKIKSIKRTLISRRNCHIVRSHISKCYSSANNRDGKLYTLKIILIIS